MPEPAELPEPLLAILREGVPALLITVDENGFPHTAFTYAATAVADRAFVVVDDASRTLANIDRTRRASLQIAAQGNLVYLLKGIVTVSDHRLNSSPVPSHRGEIELQSVKNQAWPEIAVAPLTYAYSAQARARWESAVPRIYAELRGDARE